MHFENTKPTSHFKTAACALSLALAVGACAAETELDVTTQASHNSGDIGVIVEFNSLAVTVANDRDGFFSLLGHRTIAMMNLAIHDALNSIDDEYERYAYFGSEEEDAAPVAAAAQAARDVLIDGYPDRATEIEALYDSWIDTLPPNWKTEEGMSIGAASAAAIIANRVGDNWDAFEPFPSSNVPGEYQYTPPFDFAFGYGWRLARPFAITSSDQFRQPPPPALTSAAYATDLNEVKSIGASGSTTRTADQTHIAYWWAEFLEMSHNNLAGQLAAQEGLDMWETARLYALFAMDNFDGYVAVMDGKYHHAFWRPITAIRRADEDGNAATVADPSWNSEMLTPPFPTYPSAHAQACWGAHTMFVEVFGTENVSWTYESSTAPAGGPTTRSYTNLADAATDCGMSRVYNGFHYRFDVTAGKNLGESRANYIIANFLQED